MESNDAIPRKSIVSSKNPRKTLLTEVSTALTKARKAREQVFSHLTYDSYFDASVIEIKQVTVDKGDTPM